jgi:hypothetical protein
MSRGACSRCASAVPRSRVRLRAGPAATSATPECEAAEVPGERGAEVVAYVVDVEQLMVDEALDDVERTPADKQHADVCAPRWRQLASLPHVEKTGLAEALPFSLPDDQRTA